MRRLLVLVVAMIQLHQLDAQAMNVNELIKVESQNQLHLDFPFADVIALKTWDKDEVLIEVEVEINDGEDNDMFELTSSKTSSSIRVEMNEDKWEWKKDSKRGRNCSWQVDIFYTVTLPRNMEVKANTISGDYELTYYGQPLRLKTISGAIDITVEQNQSLDFHAETISGDMYSDLEIAFPYGEEGLRQIVGQNVRGRISSGGPESKFETISGDIFLRKG